MFVEFHCPPPKLLCFFWYMFYVGVQFKISDLRNYDFDWNKLNYILFWIKMRLRFPISDLLVILISISKLEKIYASQTENFTNV